MTTFLARITSTGADRPPELSRRPVSGWAFTGLAVVSFGGPLALAALIAPAIVGDASASAGLACRGELARPSRTIRRGLTAAWLATAAVVVLAVAPLAAAPGLTGAAIPGMTAAELFAGHGFAVAIGVGVAVSIAGVMLADYLAG